MAPNEFINKWGPGGPAYALNEEQGAQSHFLDLCELLVVPKPGSEPDYLFEKQSLLLGEARGFADVFYRDHFAWENKAPGKNLDTALKQLLSYSLALSNPPLLVVCDRLTVRIHTQFNGHPSETHIVLLQQLDQPEKRALLRRLWTDPESFRPKKTTRAITEAAAHSFALLAEQLRGRHHHPDKVAHFLTQCLFCFFAEDVGLLPGRMFERMVGNRQLTSDRLTAGLVSLFTTMRDGGLYGADDIPWFNGGLFKTVDVPKLEILDITELRNAAALNWSAIDVSIFGTLFERGLDPVKRSQLGAHYTDPATIARIVQPVVERPLLAEWAEARAEIKKQTSKIKKHGDAAYRAALKRFVQWLDRLRAYRVLDPACGSGNFLFLALKALKDIEYLSHTEVAILGLDRETDLVTGPHNVLGIELNEYAAELARVTVWIGELQWRIDHGYEFKTNPVLEPLDHIECRDALVTKRVEPLEGQSHYEEAVWPQADAVVGNPPFLGDKKMRRELGDPYVDALRGVYAGRVPGGADLVCYWFDRARQAVRVGGLRGAGLVATNSIRGGRNRAVLDAVVRDVRIYDAWSDEAWVNDGADVRVSLVAFGHVDGIDTLNGQSVGAINADLTAGSVGAVSLDLSKAKPINSSGTSFIGTQKGGSFDVEGRVAREWLGQPNPHGLSNAAVLRPWINGLDLTRRPNGMWIIDFETRSGEEAALFERPWHHAKQFVHVGRVANREGGSSVRWWLLQRARPEMKAALGPISRYVATARNGKHRLFALVDAVVVPDSQVVAIARADDAMLGVVSSRFHELWSLRMCTWLGVGNDPRYTPTTCFETFPFPAGLTPADTAHQRTEALPDGALIPADLISPLRDAAARIASAAHALDALRQRWLNPPEWTHRVPEVVPLGMEHSPYPDRIEPRPGISEADRKALEKRTLTNLYNQRPAWLASAHEALDLAVAAAYAMGDEEGADFWRGFNAQTADDAILTRLLALNLQRAASEAAAAAAVAAPKLAKRAPKAKARAAA